MYVLIVYMRRRRRRRRRRDIYMSIFPAMVHLVVGS
jgi:Flp pilus assembly protein TadB